MDMFMDMLELRVNKNFAEDSGYVKFDLIYKSLGCFETRLFVIVK